MLFGYKILDHIYRIIKLMNTSGHTYFQIKFNTHLEKLDSRAFPWRPQSHYWKVGIDTELKTVFGVLEARKRKVYAN